MFVISHLIRLRSKQMDQAYVMEYTPRYQRHSSLTQKKQARRTSKSSSKTQRVIQFKHVSRTTRTAHTQSTMYPRTSVATRSRYSTVAYPSKTRHSMSKSTRSAMPPSVTSTDPVYSRPYKSARPTRSPWTHATPDKATSHVIFAQRTETISTLTSRITTTARLISSIHRIIRAHTRLRLNSADRMCQMAMLLLW